MIFGWVKWINEILGDWRDRPIVEWFPIIDVSHD